MFVTTITVILYAIQIIAPQCECLNLIDLPGLNPGMRRRMPKTKAEASPKTSIKVPVNYEPYSVESSPDLRRYWLIHESESDKPVKQLRTGKVYEDEMDANLKTTILSLVEKTMKEIKKRFKRIQVMKQKYRDKPDYKAGVILSLIKKSKDIITELQNVAIKYRDQWAILEQLKIFELISHTNKDLANYVRQLIETHVKYLSVSGSQSSVLLLI